MGMFGRRKRCFDHCSESRTSQTCPPFHCCLSNCNLSVIGQNFKDGPLISVRRTAHRSEYWDLSKSLRSTAIQQLIPTSIQKGTGAVSLLPNLTAGMWGHGKWQTSVLNYIQICIYFLLKPFWRVEDTPCVMIHYHGQATPKRYFTKALIPQGTCGLGMGQIMMHINVRSRGGKKLLT